MSDPLRAHFIHLLFLVVIRTYATARCRNLGAHNLSRSFLRQRGHALLRISGTIGPGNPVTSLLVRVSLGCSLPPGQGGNAWHMIRQLMPILRVVNQMPKAILTLRHPAG